jgi:WD40 repeat protein
MALSVDGHYLAIASLKGTIVRLFSTLDKGHDSSTGLPLREFRRGVEQAVISSLSFSLDKCWLACASDHGTVHVFKVEDEESTDSLSTRKNQSNSNGK